MTVLVAGSRSFRDYDYLAEVLDDFHTTFGEFTVLHGGAKGADELAQRWAVERRLRAMIYRPDWKKHGKAAGPIRNRQMVADADHVILFWDGESRGTASTMEYAKQTGKHLEVYYFNAAAADPQD